MSENQGRQYKQLNVASAVVDVLLDSGLSNVELLGILETIKVSIVENTKGGSQ